jgi:hypothetical protein
MLWQQPRWKHRLCTQTCMPSRIITVSPVHTRHEHTTILLRVVVIGGSCCWLPSHGDVPGKSRSSDQSARGHVARGRPCCRKSGGEQILHPWGSSRPRRTCICTRQRWLRCRISAQARAGTTFSCSGIAHLLRDAAVYSGMTPWANKSVETNRRPASPFHAGRQFERASCALLFLSAAVAHLWRWAGGSLT